MSSKKRKKGKKKSVEKGQVKKDPPRITAAQMNSDHVALSDTCCEDEFVNNNDSGAWIEVIRKQRHKTPDPRPAAPRPPQKCERAQQPNSSSPHLFNQTPPPPKKRRDKKEQVNEYIYLV